MITINGVPFHDEPGSCGTCPFFYSGSTHFIANPGKGHCTLFDEFHHSYINPPRRCRKLFKRAFGMPDGSRLCVVVND